MSVQIVRFSTDAGRIPEVEDAVGKLFAALEEAAPAGTEYSAVRVGEDGENAEFLLTLRLADGAANPLLRLPEALVFRAKVAEWAGAPAPPQPVTVLGRYSR
ncbi:hypothetical protein [Actinomadura livida]|uniref:Uncharacterized protein n=1 Tax=Actinomadura livida TaxID=79909 RepID=A0A7W7MYY0_9ACTN|nr:MULTISPECIES: hypothetical protein [Actinomadura]MBB4776391.1 hypothetical protein [Actinomadura catellatispora]GGU32875.1 hypothetical protein GCM10010208_67040 [Actinomadura livida]